MVIDQSVVAPAAGPDNGRHFTASPGQSRI
jgi:hypothetical protein